MGIGLCSLLAEEFLRVMLERDVIPVIKLEADAMFVDTIKFTILKRQPSYAVGNILVSREGIGYVTSPPIHVIATLGIAKKAVLLPDIDLGTCETIPDELNDVSKVLDAVSQCMVRRSLRLVGALRNSKEKPQFDVKDPIVRNALVCYNAIARYGKNVVNLKTLNIEKCGGRR